MKDGAFRCKVVVLPGKRIIIRSPLLPPEGTRVTVTIETLDDKQGETDSDIPFLPNPESDYRDLASGNESQS